MLAVQLDDCEETCCALLDVRSNSPSWQPTASPGRAIRFHAISAVGEYSVVMLGGGDGFICKSTDAVQLYDVRADRWSERAEWRLPAPSYGHCAALRN